MFKNIISSTSIDKDDTRREFILNIFLVGLISLSSVAFLINILDPLLYPKTRSAGSPFSSGVVLAIFIFLYILSKKQESKISAYILISLLLGVGIFSNYYWGSLLPIGSLIFALVVVMSGILIGVRFAVITTFVGGLSLTSFSYLEIIGVTHPNNSWKYEPVHLADIFVYVIILGIIATISWLFNRDIENALKRARASERALKRERDSLEQRVEERTRELRQAQAEKMIQLYRFVELGKSASGLFHDLVNPLTLVSLNVNKLQIRRITKDHISEARRAMQRASVGVEKLERYIYAARKQLQNQELFEMFSVNDEVTQAVTFLSYRAKEDKVSITFQANARLQLKGNPVKFNQLVTNLISNAVESFDGLNRTTRQVNISMQRIAKKVEIKVSDNGSGISRDNLSKIFEPLFTTKPIDKGFGLGLSICKEIVEKGFNGSIKVDSEPNLGTTFSIVLPLPRGNSKREHD